MAGHVTLFTPFWADPVHTGVGIIQGITTFDDVPGPARVYAQDPRNLQVVRAARSAADGSYVLPNLNIGAEYLITAVDDKRQDNAVVMDRVQAGIP